MLHISEIINAGSMICNGWLLKLVILISKVTDNYGLSAHDKKTLSSKLFLDSEFSFLAFIFKIYYSFIKIKSNGLLIQLFYNLRVKRNLDL